MTDADRTARLSEAYDHVARAIDILRAVRIDAGEAGALGKEVGRHLGKASELAYQVNVTAMNLSRESGVQPS